MGFFSWELNFCIWCLITSISSCISNKLTQHTQDPSCSESCFYRSHYDLSNYACHFVRACFQHTHKKEVKRNRFCILSQKMTTKRRRNSVMMWQYIVGEQNKEERIVSFKQWNEQRHTMKTVHTTTHTQTHTKHCSTKHVYVVYMLSRASHQHAALGRKRCPS